MSFQPVILWTDALIFVLVAAVALFAVYAARHEHLRAPWRQVARRPLAMAAACVLGAYVLVGLLDSVHFRARLAGSEQFATEVKSLLDVLIAPLAERVEKTYSAPFALYGYTKETVEHPDGRRTREYPRLRYGGVHLADPAERGPDIARRLARGAAYAAAIWLVLVAVFVAGFRRPGEGYAAAAVRLVRGETVLPWRTIWLTLGAIVLVVCELAVLSPYYHVLGTDQVGQDVLWRSVKSIRTGLVIGTLTTLVMLPFALLLGVAAGYFRGWVDDLVQYLYTTLSSIPDVLLIAAAVLSLHVYMANHPEAFGDVVTRADARLLFLCLILGITSWTSLCRLLRGETLKLRELDYVQAAQALGAGHFAVMARHLFPNVMHIVLIVVVLDFSGLVLAEAVLSYVGVGVDPTMESWGNMINGARLEMAREPMVWWSLAAAFLFMFTLVLAANLFADAVRDAFDPRLRR
jgi:peptide/nickel transport system permease protein